MFSYLPYPAHLYSQFWFTNGNQDFFELEEEFRGLDFLFIDHSASSSDEEEIEEIFLFLYRIHNKGAKWLLSTRDNSRVRTLFTSFHFHVVLHRKELVYITNYPITS